MERHPGDCGGSSSGLLQATSQRLLGGELRNPRSSFMYFFTAGMIGTVIWYSLVTWLAYNAYGGFILQYNYVYNLYSAGTLNATDAAAVAPYMLLPSMPLFSASLAGSTIVLFFAAWWFYPITSVIVTYLAGTRCMFGMSFDRMFPAVFGKVSERMHTPVPATIACMIGGIIVALLTLTSYGFLAACSQQLVLVRLRLLDRRIHCHSTPIQTA